MTPVFLDYDQATLDRNYDQRAWAPNAETVIARYGTASAAVRGRLRHHADIAYGPTPAERLDWFPTDRPDAPVLIFIHGGAWRSLSKAESCFAAPAFVAAGAHFVALDFALLPAVRLPEMVDQVQRALAWVHQHARSYGGDPDRLYLAGHSSGGHLAACVLASNASTLLKGGLCASGMYDLAPVMLSARSSYVHLDEAEIGALSPQRHLDRLSVPVLVAYGEYESDEFKRHARDFARATAEAGRLAGLLHGPGQNHFEIAETLGQADGLLGQAMLRMMALP